MYNLVNDYRATSLVADEWTYTKTHTNIKQLRSISQVHQDYAGGP